MAYVSDKGPGELTALTSLATDDVFVVGDTSDASEVAKGITKANLVTDLTTNFATAAQGATADTATQPGDALTTLSGDLPFTQVEQIATNRILGRATAGTGDVEALTAVQAADTIGVGTGDSPQFTAVNVGHATDTTITRVSAGVIAVEGTNVSLAGHTHTASEVTDFDTEVANNSAVTANTAKLTADTTNVTAAGALMDSEVTNLAQVKAFDTTDYATAAQGSTADSAVQPASTDTLTNKRITKRTGTTTSSATPTIATDSVDEYYLTAQAADITSMTTNLSGTPTLGQTLYISIKGTAARSITWGASFTNGAVALPTTTTTTLELMTFFKYNGTAWACMATGSTV